MNRTLLGMALAVAMVGATVARADDFRYGEHRAVPVPGAWGHHPRFDGRYELRTVQRWVPAEQQQVWVAGQCYASHRGHHRHHTRCVPGHYETVTRPGHYEARQEWVWVSFRGPRFGVSYRAEAHDTFAQVDVFSK